MKRDPLQANQIVQGDCRELIPRIAADSVALSLWSPPYHVGKEYESQMDYGDWRALLRETIRRHFPVIRPGGFLAINVADILCFKDSSMPRIMAENIRRRKCEVTREQVLAAMREYPEMSRQQIADRLGCSEQTVDRRLKGNNIRGGKYEAQTRVKLVGGFLEECATDAGFYLYDRRVWVKDAAWENSRWHSISYRAVDEFEYIYIFWKPGVTRVDRERLTKEEWIDWGSRAVWSFPSVRANDDHEAKFPLELPRRCIRLFTDPGDVVLDCFLGSGTTAVAAIGEGRRYIGMDLVPEYVRLAKRACLQASQAASGRTLKEPRGDPTEAGQRQFDFFREPARHGARQTHHPLP
ncbi:MAG: helix-turn-helix domain-containing protein [Candidatus Accumulibacter sp.]|jgi:site-specific DNA-methyltransferase (adenine-specific)|nr:helix-turn-helix domain-containing protein [Accumulibacter sp.]